MWDLTCFTKKMQFPYETTGSLFVSYSITSNICSAEYLTLVLDFTCTQTLFQTVILSEVRMVIQFSISLIIIITAPNLIHRPLCLWQQINVQIANRERGGEPLIQRKWVLNRNRWCHWTMMWLTRSSSVIIFHNWKHTAFMLGPQHWCTVNTGIILRWCVGRMKRKHELYSLLHYDK